MNPACKRLLTYRNTTLNGEHLQVFTKIQPSNLSRNGIESTQWFLQLSESGDLISPWHDLDSESSINQDFTVTGVIENSIGDDRIIKCKRDLEFNPLMQK